MNEITTAEKIRIMCKRRDVTITDLGKRLGTSGQNISNKLARDNFTERELHKIAEALGYSYISYFTDENGQKL